MKNQILFVAGVLTSLSIASSASAETVLTHLSCRISNGVEIKTKGLNDWGNVLLIDTQYGFMSRAATARAWSMMKPPHYSSIMIDMEKPAFGDVENYSLRLTNLDPESELRQNVTGILLRLGSVEASHVKMGDAKCSVQLGPRRN